MNWNEGAGRIPFRSVDGLYIIERLVSPERHWIAYFRPCLGTLTSCGEPRDDIELAKADADAHFEGLKARAAA